MHRGEVVRDDRGTHRVGRYCRPRGTYSILGCRLLRVQGAFSSAKGLSIAGLGYVS